MEVYAVKKKLIVQDWCYGILTRLLYVCLAMESGLCKHNATHTFLTKNRITGEGLRKVKGTELDLNIALRKTEAF